VARLGAAICRIVQQNHLSQADVGATLGITQPKVSALLHYKLEGWNWSHKPRTPKCNE
jgi:predicted XRE-type DNA-binding protein